MKMTRKQKILITFYLISFVTGLTVVIELCFGYLNLSIEMQWILGIISGVSFLIAMCCFVSNIYKKK